MTRQAAISLPPPPPCVPHRSVSTIPLTEYYRQPNNISMLEMSICQQQKLDNDIPNSYLEMILMSLILLLLYLLLYLYPYFQHISNIFTLLLLLFDFLSLRAESFLLTVHSLFVRGDGGTLDAHVVFLGWSGGCAATKKNADKTKKAGLDERPRESVDGM